MSSARIALADAGLAKSFPRQHSRVSVEYSLRRLFTETYSNNKPGAKGQPQDSRGGLVAQWYSQPRQYPRVLEGRKVAQNCGTVNDTRNGGAQTSGDTTFSIRTRLCRLPRIRPSRENSGPAQGADGNIEKEVFGQLSLLTDNAWL